MIKSNFLKKFKIKKYVKKWKKFILGYISVELIYILFFISLIINIKRTSFYDYNKQIINNEIFFFKYIFFNITMDLSLQNFV